jgi:hypothetical protein
VAAALHAQHLHGTGSRVTSHKSRCFAAGTERSARLQYLGCIVHANGAEEVPAAGLLLAALLLESGEVGRGGWGGWRGGGGAS